MNKIPALGYLAFASFIICAVSGVLLTPSYNYSQAYQSISNILLTNPLANFIRAVHYWSAQFSLILIIFHIIDHLIKKSEYIIKNTIWIRLTLIIPVIFYLMFSGFLLRADSDAQQARNITEKILLSIPLIGHYLKIILFGIPDNLYIIFIHHVITATILVWLSTIEHSKKIFANAKYITFIAFLVFIFAFFFVPNLSYPDNKIIKGPWYFIGIQEILHYLPTPLWLISIIFLSLLLFLLLPKFRKRNNKKVKIILLFLLILYLVLSTIAFFLRFESWELYFPWKKAYPDYFNSYKSYFIENKVNGEQIKIILGKPESCLNCHIKTSGFVKSHNLDLIGCSSCHLGNPFSLNKDVAHKSMILIPGNFLDADRTCGKIGCHPDQFSRVNKSLMNTMSGVVAVDKWVFDESKNLNEKYNIKNIGNSPADRHLKNLCASCHLNKTKNTFGPINELSRGGGCNACHLQYDNNSIYDLKSYKKRKFIDTNKIFHHPKLTIRTNNSHCFGCHSRSGRISLSYEGWHETKLNSIPDNNKFRKLLDNRILEKQLPDIHFEKGMICIDCHLSYEIMGDGKSYSHKEEQVKIQCDDCHDKKYQNFIPYDDIDYETQRIIDLRDLYKKGRKFLQSKSGFIYPNVYDDNGKIILKLKNKDTLLYPKPIIKECGNDIEGHKRLTCQSCHNQWSPQCIGCHTEYSHSDIGYNNLSDKKEKGAWIEFDGIFVPERPILGVSQIKNKINTYIPGMILTIKKDSIKKFKRLFSPAFSHTIRKNSRTCKNCHYEPNSIGYGRGELIMDIKSRTLKFHPKYRNLKFDNLPEDAWIGFLKNPLINSSTRKFNRAFNTTEQKNILNVGVCFTCHDEKNKKFIEIFKKVDWKKKITKKCILLFP